METSYLVYRLTVAIQADGDKFSLKGAWLRNVTRFKFWEGPSISLELLKLELSNFVQRETIASLAKKMTKGAWFCSRDPFLYAQLWS